MPTLSIMSFDNTPDGIWTVATIASDVPFARQMDSTLQTWLNLSPR